MKKSSDKLLKLRAMILKENSIKAAASELNIPYYLAHRNSRHLDIRQVWVTEEEHRAILAKRK